MCELTLTADVNPGICDLFKDTSLIYALETLAAIAAIVQNQEALAGKAVMLFVDNTAALNAMLKSTSSDDTTASLIRLMWSVVATKSIDLWIEWAPSAQNLADPPSRDRKLPIAEKRVGAFQDLSRLISQAREPDTVWPEKSIPLIPQVSGEGHRNQ